MTAQNLKKSLLNYAISGKLSAKWRKENPNSRIPNSRIPTDFEPPFEIPNTWSWVKLGDLGEVILGGTPSTQNENYFGGDIAWVTPADLNENTVYISKGRRNITEEGLKNSSAKLMPKGSVLFSTRAPVGYVAIAENEISTNQGFKSIVLKDFAFNKYIYFVLKSLNNLANSLAGGTTFKELSSTNFKSLPIPLPPKDEQEFIVNELEKLMILADSYEVEFQRLEHCKKELKKLKKSILNYSISGKLSTKWRKENSRIPNDLKSRIPSDFNPPFEIPNSWQWVKLGEKDFCEIYTGDSINKDFKEKHFLGKPNGIPYIGTKDLENENFNYENGVKITDEFLPKFKKAKANSVLMCIEGGSAGRKIGILSQEVCFGNKLCCFYSEKINMKFLFYFFKSGLFNKIFTQELNGIIGGVSIKKLEKFYIPLPPKDEQEIIVKKIDELFDILELIESSL